MFDSPETAKSAMAISSTPYWDVLAYPKPRTITEDFALKYMALDKPPYQRKVQDWRVSAYFKVASKGFFRPVDWAIAFCIETNRWHFINGWNTATMYSTKASKIEYKNIAMVTRYRVQTKDHLVKLYAQFDTKTSMRTESDINMAVAACVPSLNGVPVSLLNAITRGIALSKEDGNRMQINKYRIEERAEFMLDYLPFVIWCNELIGGSRATKYFRRAPVMAVVFETYMKDKEAAIKFWGLVKNDNGESPECADRILRKYLEFTNIKEHSARKKAKDGTDRADQKEFYIMCRAGWNQWRRGIRSNKNKLLWDVKDGVPALA